MTMHGRAHVGAPPVGGWVVEPRMTKQRGDNNRFGGGDRCTKAPLGGPSTFWRSFGRICGGAGYGRHGCPPCTSWREASKRVFRVNRKIAAPKWFFRGSIWFGVASPGLRWSQEWFFQVLAAPKVCLCFRCLCVCSSLFGKLGALLSTTRVLLLRARDVSTRLRCRDKVCRLGARQRPPGGHATMRLSSRALCDIRRQDCLLLRFCT